MSSGSTTSSAAAGIGGSTGSSGGGNGSGSSSGGSGPCGACKFLRRKCVAGCIFAPYFDSEQGAAHFAAVHKVFGASNVSKLLLQIPAHKRLDAVVTICYEAQARLRDPVYGCVAHIFALQQQVVSLQAELSYLQAHLTTLELPSPPPLPPPPPPPPQSVPAGAHFSISELPAATTLPSAVDLSALFDPPPPQINMTWAAGMSSHYQAPTQPRTSELEICNQLGHVQSTTGSLAAVDSSGGGDLQALARELVDRHRSAKSEPRG